MGIRQAILQVMNDHTDVNEYFDALFDSLSDDGFVWGQPDKGEFNYAMNQLASWCSSEKKLGVQGRTTAQSRSDLIKQIKEKVTAYPQVSFAGIYPTVYAIQLALRVRRPRCIDQGDTALCGAVAAVYLFAKNNPSEFVQFALDLFFKGVGKFGGLTVEPSSSIRSNYRLRRNKIPWAFDYVVLVSLRQCTFMSDRIGVGALRGADETTLPGEVSRWLTESGYDNVEDHTFFGKNQQGVVKQFSKFIGQSMHLPGSTSGRAVRTDRLGHAAQSLNAAEMAIANGKLVILFADGKIAQSLKDGNSDLMNAGKGPVALGHHHWTTVRRLSVQSNSVFIKVVTWGATYSGSFSLDAFLSRYGGYIAADPGNG